MARRMPTTVGRVLDEGVVGVAVVVGEAAAAVAVVAAPAAIATRRVSCVITSICSL